MARRAERPLETAIALGLSGTWWALRDLRHAHELVEEGGLLMERAGNPNWLAQPYERIVRERGVADITRVLDDAAASTACARGRELAFEDAMTRAREVTGPA